MACDLSYQQRFWNLYARLVQKPALRFIRAPTLSRALVTLNAIIIHKTPAGLRLLDIDLHHRGASVKATQCTTTDAGPSGTLLYFHGGGFTIGNLRQYRHLVARLGDRTGQRALFVHYRLAPEHPYPAALDDCLTAYRAVLNDPSSGPVTLAGDSAGGNLVFALLLRIKAAGLPLPAASLALSPVVDLRLVNPSLKANARSDHLVAMSWGQRCIDDYLAGYTADDPYASPIFGDFTGATPVLLQYDTTEVLFDDGRLMAHHLRDQGVTVTEQTTTGCTHVWQLNIGRSPEATASVKDATAFLRAQLKDAHDGIG